MTIAQLDGLSLGGGSEVALACQAIVATDKVPLASENIGIFRALAVWSDRTAYRA